MPQWQVPAQSRASGSERIGARFHLIWGILASGGPSAGSCHYEEGAEKEPGGSFPGAGPGAVTVNRKGVLWGPFDAVPITTRW